MQPHWDIFCRVVDNFGDVGVCWRLARQLASEHDLQVRLWVDDLDCLAHLCPSVDIATRDQRLDGVDIRHWQASSPIDRIADVVIEAFACDLPAAYVNAMAKQAKPPRWINLEYLTAEDWAARCHAMASPHPALPLVKHFFFPGFSPETGGLLRESGLLAQRDVMRRAHLGEALQISLFCYDTAPVGALLDCLARSPVAVRCLVPPGQPLATVETHFGGKGPWTKGNLVVEPIPFLSQTEYDDLLWRCDINFVRGEDSFLRAQWAGKAFVWQIYRQAENAHLIKLDAFLERYTATLDAPIKAAVIAMFHAWNIGDGVETSWPDFLQLESILAEHTTNWAGNLAQHPDLASSLVSFCSVRV